MDGKLVERNMTVAHFGKLLGHQDVLKLCTEQRAVLFQHFNSIHLHLASLAHVWWCRNRVQVPCSGALTSVYFTFIRNRLTSAFQNKRRQVCGRLVGRKLIGFKLNRAGR